MKEDSKLNIINGPVPKAVMQLYVPVLMSSLVSQIYSFTNQIIVGNYISKDALSAVSACDPITKVFSSFYMGLSVGSGIIIAKQYGARDKEGTKDSFRTFISFSLVLGLILTVLSELMVPFFLQVCNVRPDLVAYASNYMRIYLAGGVILIIYNMCTSILNSIGDAKHSLYYLIISSVINIVLGIVFVRFMNLGVEGTAIATTIAQLAVTVISMVHLHSMEEFKINYLQFSLKPDIAKEILHLGIPAAIHYSAVNFSFVLIQTYVNQFSNEAIAGIGISASLGWWANAATNAFGTAVTTFVGQNLGANKHERVKECVRFTTIVGTFFGILWSGIIYLFASPLVSMFNQDPTVLAYGIEATRTTIMSFVIIAYSHIFNSAIRASGNMRVPVIISISCQSVARVLFCFVFMPIMKDVKVIYYSQVFSNILAGVVPALYYFFGSWTKEHDMRIF